MNEEMSFSALLRSLKEEAKNIRRATGKKHKVVLEELARKFGFPNYDTLQKRTQLEMPSSSLCASGVAQGDMFPLGMSGVVTDIPPPVPTLNSAVCRTPSEFVFHRGRYGNPTYAVQIWDDDSGRLDNTWFFASEVQDAVAIGMRWHERGCALEQYPEVEDGEICYGYRIRGLTHYRQLEDLLYANHLWERTGADLNARASPEIMTRLRKELFSVLTWWPDEHIFMMLDFSRPSGGAEFLQHWANEIEE